MPLICLKLVCWRALDWGCSKLTTSLVNVSLQFQTLLSEIVHKFLSKTFEKLKASLIISTKNFSVFGYKVMKYLTS